MTLQHIVSNVKVDENGCWIWQRYIAPNGYGRINYRGKAGRSAHRVAYELAKGETPPGLTIDHLCRVRACVNPDHLEPVTHAENVARAPRRIEAHCAQGHEFTPENTYCRPNSGFRQCRACQREAVRRYKNRKKAA